jgi:purine-binding chemotaxis protein CheW
MENGVNNTNTKDSEHQVLTFFLGDEIYGLDILRAQEIKGWERTTLIPNTPSFVKGVINLRGAIVPVIDLRERFGISKISYDETTVVIIVKTLVGESDQHEKIMGWVVDGVSDVHAIDIAQLQPAPSSGHNGLNGDFIRGLSTIDEKMVIVLNIDKLIEVGVLGLLK